MKIIITSVGKAKSFLVEVLDGDAVLYSEEVKGVKRRDALVWQLAETYNTSDIENVVLEKRIFRLSDVPSIPVLDEVEADSFFDENKEFLYDRIVQAIEEGLIAGLDTIDLFELNGTGVCITSKRHEWMEGLQQALEYYIEVQQYEKGGVVKKIMDDLTGMYEEGKN